MRIEHAQAKQHHMIEHVFITIFQNVSCNDRLLKVSFKMDAKTMKSRSVMDMSKFLSEKEISRDFCKTFEGGCWYMTTGTYVFPLHFLDNFIDGKAFLKLSEGDVRKMIPPIGLTKKIFALIHLVSLHVPIPSSKNG